MSDWFKANLLTLNPNKTVAMSFLHKKPKGKLVSINLENITIRFVKETKFLGIWLDENLNWNAHTSKLITRLKRNTYLSTVKSLQLSRHLHSETNLPCSDPKSPKLWSNPIGQYGHL